ncbi:MAG: hypothetical protein ABR529_15070 [Actinomycetota bacterium]
MRIYSLTGDPTAAKAAGNDALAGAGGDCSSATPATGPVPSGTQVSITCSAPYPPALFVFDKGGSLTSTAEMRRE